MRTVHTYDEAKELIDQLQQLDDVTIATDDFNYHIERVTDNEYRVSKMASFMTLEVKYFNTVADILDYIY